MCLTIGSKEEGRCGIGVIHGGIPHDRACPPGGVAHSGGKYPWLEGGGGVLELLPRCPAGGGGGQYPAGSSGSHVEVCLVVGDRPCDIMGVVPI
jgi:hypothetical protein